MPPPPAAPSPPSPPAAAPTESLSARYFDDVYGAHADPWDFETSGYEAEKYRVTMAALGSRRYDSGFEIGCSIGVLSRQLADVCGRLLSVDVSEAPLAQARARCADRPHVRFERLQVPQEFPDETFDLVVMSEVGYYWTAADLATACRRIEASLAPGGAWLLVHWTPPVHDYPLTGDAVHDHVLGLCSGSGSGSGLRHVSGRRQSTYRLDLVQKPV